MNNIKVVRMAKAIVVENSKYYGEGYVETSFGIVISDRYIPIGHSGHNVTEEQTKLDRSFANEIVRRWNANE